MSFYDDVDEIFRKRREQDEANARRLIRATPFVWQDPRTMPRRAWLHGRHYVRKYLSATIAAGGIGKSSLATVEALEMVTGRALINPHGGPKLRVWYWNGEDPRDETQRRTLAACKHFGVSPDEIEDRLCFDSGREVPIILATESRRGLALATPIVDALKDELRARKIDVMIIDPFVRCRLVSENDNGQINAVAEAWAGIADYCNAAITRSEAISESGDLTSIPSSNDVPGPGRVIIPPRPFGSVTGFSVGQLDVGLNSQHLQNMFKIFF